MASPPLSVLRTFEAAARHRSFARAAAELNVTAAAVSQQMRLLEQRLGVELFTRAARGLTVTSAGRDYAARVATAAPDGNTLLFASASQIIIAPLVQKTSYDPQRDFVPVSIFGAGPYILGIKPSLPANTFQEFIAYAKNNPGKLNYASAGPGGIIHLATALLASRAGIQMTHVPYKSGAPALNGLLTGEIDVYFGNASELLPQASSGRRAPRCAGARGYPRGLWRGGGGAAHGRPSARPGGRSREGRIL